SGSSSIGFAELLTTSQAAQSNPFQQTFRVAAGHQEEPAEPNPLLDQQLAQAWLRQQVAAVAVGEEPLAGIVGILGVHPATQNRPEFAGSAGMQVDRVQAGSKPQARPHQ